jgi:glycosyltransferase involved in cell wall biosynthesis
VSVVIPCFNAAQYLPLAVRSILAQNLPETEVLIVDDCSTDDSREVAQSLACQFPMVKLVRQPANAGPAVARNLGLRLASGRYICFLDADDEYMPGFFDRVLPPLEQNAKLAGIITGLVLFDCHRPVHEIQLQSIVVSLPSNLIVRRGVAEMLGGFPEAPVFRGKAAGEDIAFRFALRDWFNLIAIPEPFLLYRAKRGSHLDFFLDRSRVIDGKIVLTSSTDEEKSGELAAAHRLYNDRIAQRFAALASLKQVPPFSQASANSK